MIDPLFLEMLACPACKASLVEKGEQLHCANTATCGGVYAIEDGIPILLVEERIDRRQADAAKSAAKTTPEKPSAGGRTA